MSPMYRLLYLWNKYQHNQCSATELQELLLLLNEADDDELDVPMRALWQQVKERGDTYPLDWPTLYANVTKNTDPKRVLPTSQTAALWRPLTLAAAVIIIISLWALLYHYRPITTQAPRYAEMKVPIKSTGTIQLGDGSKVTLNAASRLRYPKRFTDSTRDVYLEGEAIFDVAEDSHRPFIVHSGTISTRVLGTSFNVKAYPGAERIEVTVISGKVSVEETKSGRKAILRRQERITFTTATHKFEATQLPGVEKTVAWQKGKLSFDDASLAEVASQFYRKYGIKMRLEGNGLLHCRLSLAFNQERPENIIATIAALSNAEYRRDGDTVVIYGKGCL